jgi:hypothetical protein
MSTARVRARGDELQSTSQSAANPPMLQPANNYSSQFAGDRTHHYDASVSRQCNGHCERSHGQRRRRDPHRPTNYRKEGKRGAGLTPTGFGCTIQAADPTLRLPRRKNVETYRGAASRGCNHSFSPTPQQISLCLV